MPIEVIIPVPLRRLSGGAPSALVEANTVGAALDALFAQHPSLASRMVGPDGCIPPYLILKVGEVELDRSAFRAVPVSDGDRVDILGAVEGGSEPIPAEPTADVRMRGFRERVSVATALVQALDGAHPLAEEEVRLEEAAGRVLARTITSPVDVPPFPRSAMDGYAVIAEDTYGAGLYSPIAFGVVGESMPGIPFGSNDGAAPPLGHGEAVRIMTGARIPLGADAVIPAEETRPDSDGLGDGSDGPEQVQIVAATTPGKHIGAIGEDVSTGDELLARGRRLRPQDIGLLASIGAVPVPVHRRPRVRIIATGNELLAAGSAPAPDRIIDSNTPMLAHLVARDGGTLEDILLLPDDPERIRTALVPGPWDVLLTAGGSSVGREDHIPNLVREAGNLPVHGISMRPSSPTGIGRIGGNPVFLLPGNPVSCLCAYDTFAGPAIRSLAGRHPSSPYVSVRLPLARRIVSKVGRFDYVRVSVADDATGAASPLAVSGASILSSTTRAAGFVLVPEDSEGMPEGAEVEVFLYDAPPNEVLARSSTGQ